MDEFKKRISTASVFGPLVAFLFYFLPPFPFFLFISFLTFIAVREGVRISQTKMKHPVIFFSMLSLFFLYQKKYDLFLVWLLLVSSFFVLIHILSKDHSSAPEILNTVATNAIVTFFIIFPFFYLYALKELNNLYPLLLLFVIWASDTLAYFSGKAFGKHKLCPSISPNKTVEGLLGAIFGSTLVLVGFKNLVGFGFFSAILVGITIGFLGQIGDIFESSVKRVFGFKDSSSILPGHGGILDRADSFIFTAPLLYRILTL